MGKILWTGEKISPRKVTILKRQKVESITYTKVSIYDENFWVIRNQIKDERFYPAKKLESFLKIKQLKYIVSGNYVLYKSRNPNISPELPLNKFLQTLKQRKIEVPIHVKNQVRLIYCFRCLFGLSQNTNSNLCVRKNGHNYTVYNLKFSFGKQRTNLPNSVFNFWFTCSDLNQGDPFQKSMFTLICGKNNVSIKEFSLFRKKLDSKFTKILLKTPDLVWYQSQIINYLIDSF